MLIDAAVLLAAFAAGYGLRAWLCEGAPLGGLVEIESSAGTEKPPLALGQRRLLPVRDHILRHTCGPVPRSPE
jgi:hypothetical protein